MVGRLLHLRFNIITFMVGITLWFIYITFKVIITFMGDTNGTTTGLLSDVRCSMEVSAIGG